MPIKWVGTMTLNRNPTNYFAGPSSRSLLSSHADSFLQRRSRSPSVLPTSFPVLTFRTIPCSVRRPVSVLNSRLIRACAELRNFSYFDTQLSRLGGPNCTFTSLPHRSSTSANLENCSLLAPDQSLALSLHLNCSRRTLAASNSSRSSLLPEPIRLSYRRSQGWTKLRRERQGCDRSCCQGRQGDDAIRSVQGRGRSSEATTRQVQRILFSGSAFLFVFSFLVVMTSMLT